MVNLTDAANFVRSFTNKGMGLLVNTIGAYDREIGGSFVGISLVSGVQCLRSIPHHPKAALGWGIVSLISAAAAIRLFNPNLFLPYDKIFRTSSTKEGVEGCLVQHYRCKGVVFCKLIDTIWTEKRCPELAAVCR